MSDEYRFRGYWNKETQKFEWDKPMEEPVQVHAVIQDEMEPLESMVDHNRRIFTSRSQYKRHLKEHGMEVTGGDHLTHEPPAPSRGNYEDLRNDIAKAENDIRWGNVQVDERQKETWKQEQRNYQAWKQRNWKS